MAPAVTMVGNSEPSLKVMPANEKTQICRNFSLKKEKRKDEKLPRVEINSGVGLYPNIPHLKAGIRKEPPMSLPIKI